MRVARIDNGNGNAVRTRPGSPTGCSPSGKSTTSVILRRGSSQRSVLYTSGLLFKERLVVARDPDTVAGSKVPYFKVTKLSSFSSLTVRVGRPTTHSVLSAARSVGVSAQKVEVFKKGSRADFLHYTASIVMVDHGSTRIAPRR